MTPREHTAGRTALLESARFYASRGWPVFPMYNCVDGQCTCSRGPDCPSPGKHPRTTHGFKDASTDLTQIEAWWARWPDATIAVPTGAATFIGLDVDPKTGGDESLSRLIAQHGPLPETVEVLTGGGGRHLYFRPPRVTVPNSESLVALGLDIRGHGGCVVMPPSGHQSGRCYAWEVTHDPESVALADMPQWLLEQALASTPARNGDASAGTTDWAAWLQGVPEGQRHGVVTQLAGHYLGRKLPPEEVEQICLGVAARCHPPHDPDDVRRVVRDLAAKDASRRDPAAGAPGWPLYDGSEAWEFPAVSELIESLLPASGVVWWGGLPKRYKSLFALYCSLAIACRRSSIARKFLVRAFPKILYVAREDGGARLQDRREDILRAWTERPDPGAILFAIRPRLDLLDPVHVAWLRDTCLTLGITMLVLDTWTALSPSADPLSAKDQAALAAVVVRLAEDIGGLVVVVDHSRKNRPDGQPLSSADIFGPPQKWAAAEHIVMLDVVQAGHRLEVFIEGKDLETRRFFLTVSPRDSEEEKFAYAGSVEELAAERQQVGDRNRQAVLETLQANPDGLSSGGLVRALTAADTRLSQDTVTRHCKALVQAGLAEKLGSGKDTRFVAVNSVSPHPPCAEKEGQTT